MQVVIFEIRGPNPALDIVALEWTFPSRNEVKIRGQVLAKICHDGSGRATAGDTAPLDNKRTVRTG
jgi:hypothetical protein